MLHHISSLPNNAGQLLAAIRSHWGFDEDGCRVRKGYASENMAVLRHMVLNLLKQEKTSKRGVKSRRPKAGWDETCLLKVLGIT